MAKSDIPFSIDALTPGWLGSALANAGVVSKVRIASIEHEQVAGGSGLFGTVMRLIPAYDPADAEAPSSVIIKIPVAEEQARGIGVALRLYEREVHF